MIIQTDLINERAWSFHYTTGIEFDELQSQATLAYLEACKLYDSNKGAKLTTFAYRAITNNLITFCKAYKETNIKVDYNDNIFGGVFTKVGVDIEEAIARFPKGVQDLIKIVLSHSDEEQFDFTNVRKIIGHVHYVLEFNYNWGQRRRKGAIRQLKEILKEIPEGELF